MPESRGPLLPRPVTTAHPLAQAAAVVGGSLAVPTAGSVAVTGITHDSHEVRPGDLYAAMPGSRHHGSSFAAEVARAGAVAALTDPAGQQACEAAGLATLVVPNPRGVLGELAAWIYGHPARRLLTLGVTGTNGKTTVTHLMDGGLRAAGHTVGLLGTVGTRVGDEWLATARTTPEATEVHALLGVMADRGCTAVAMEVSSHAMSLGRVDGVAFDVVAFTNLSQDHLDFHTGMEDYYAAKASLFTLAHARTGVVCVDDAWGRRLAAEADLPVATCSAGGADAHWRAVEVELRPEGSSFVALGPQGQSASCSVRLPGAFNVANALVAVAALAAAGVPLADAARGVGQVDGVPGRMERIDVGQPYLALVDYAHTPEALETLLVSLRAVTPGRLIVVFGAGGDRDRGKRPLMGAAAAQCADVVVLTSDNPRSEDPLAILAALEQGARESAAGALVRVVPDRGEAIDAATSMAGPGDTVVVAGKGHEQGQEAAGQVRPFDDRVALRAAVEANR